MQDAFDWTSDGPQYDDQIDAEPAADAVVPSHFDPLVQDALAGTSDLDALIEETAAGLPAAPTVPTGPFTGLEGAVPGGSGTAEIAGFINSSGADLTDLTNTVLDGRELSDAQIATGEHIASRGIDTSPLELNDRIDQSVTESELRERYEETAHKVILEAIPGLSEIDGTMSGAEGSLNGSDVELSRGPTLRPKWGSAF